MPRKTGLEIQQGILALLSEEERSLRELETRLNTNYNTVRAHCRMLAFYGLIELIERPRSRANGRPYTLARITDAGRALARKRGIREILP